MPPELLVEATRGGTVESRHYGHAVVVDRHGRILFSVGDAGFPTFPRSSLKPLQALAGLAKGTAERFDFTDAEIAVTCASHSAEARHLTAVARILEKVDATEADLRCGPHAVPDPATREALIRANQLPTPIHNNCSGKHSGMLALARVLGAPLEGYWEADHPVQREVQRVLALTAGTDLDALTWGVDGCGVPTYLMPLHQLALGFARLAAPDDLGADEAAARRISSAMIAEPEMVRGEGGFDSVLMRALGNAVISKGGAEGCQAIGLLGSGVGIAVKVEDGGARPLAPVALTLLRRFGGLDAPFTEVLEKLERPTIPNTRGEAVGEVRCVI